MPSHLDGPDVPAHVPEAPVTGSAATVGGGRATRDIAAQVLGRLFNLALGIVVTALIARTLGERGFGQWSTLFVVVQLAGYLTDLGLDSVAVQGAVKDPKREARWVGALVSLRFLLVVPVLAATLVVVLLLASSDQMLMAGIALSAGLLNSVPGALRVVFQLRVRNDIPIGVMTVNSVLWGAAVIVLAVQHGSMTAFAVCFLVVGTITALLQAGLSLREVAVRFAGARRLWPELVRVGVPVALGGLLITAYGRIDQIIVFELAGAREAGLYGAVYRVLDQAQFLPISLTTTLLPILSAVYVSDPQRVPRVLQTAADYLTMGSLGALAFALAAAGPTVRFLFGAGFADAAPALPILMGAFVLISFGYLAGMIVLILRLQRAFVGFAAAGLLVNVVLNLLLVPGYGFLAAAWITLVTELVVLTLTFGLILRHLAYRPSLGRLLRTGIAAAVLAGILLALRAAGTPLGGLAAAAAVVYPLLLLALGTLRITELTTMLRKDS